MLSEEILFSRKEGGEVAKGKLLVTQSEIKKLKGTQTYQTT